jgi:carbon monoxide dehydrogenase subunit G
MARYVCHVRSPRSQAEAFDYLADLTNFAEWDPGVESSTQIEGDGPALGAVFEVAVKGVVGTLDLRYHVTEYQAPDLVVARASTRMLTSLDTITVRADGEGSIVTYDADLTLNGVLGLADPGLRLVFGRIGDRAAAGLVRALQGERIADPGGASDD